MQVAVIGAGIYGTSIAYFLSKEPDIDVTLYDKNKIGGITTSKSAGIIRHHYSNKFHIELAKRGSDILNELDSHVGHDGGYHQNGHLSVASSEHEDELRHNVRLEQEAGVDVELIDPATITDYVPEASPKDVAVAALDHDGGFADPYLVATGFAQAASENGAQIRTDTEIVDFELANNRIKSVVTRTGSESFSVVVNAAGPGAKNVAAMADEDLPLQCYETKCVSLSVDQNYSIEKPTLSDVTLDFWIKPEPGDGNEFLAAGIDPAWEHAEIEPGDKLASVTNEDFLKLQKKFKKRVPSFANAEVVDSWTGVITATPDWHQIVGRSSVENLYHLVGASGHGFKEGAGFGEALAQRIVSDEPDHSLSHYRPDRFEDGELITTEYGAGSHA